MSQRENAKVQQSVGGDNLNTMVLLGINSNEKCTIGNAILKEDHFKAASNTFVRVEGKVAGQNFCIINTPDLIQRPSCDPEANTMEEMKPSYTGQRMFLLVLQDNKLSKEETEMFTQLKERFGSKMVESTIVVLVTSEKKRSRQPYSQADENLKEVLDQCGKRICVHNKNRDTEDTELIPQVMQYWGEMQEMQAHESINLTSQPSGEENLFEEVDTIKLMKEVPQVSTVSEKNKGENIQSSGGDNKITVVLLGKNSHDKCLIGNTILGNRHFKSEKTTCEKAEENLAGQKFCIIITPDIFHKSNSDSQADIIEELKPSYPGARMFLLVLQEKKLSQKKMEMLFQLKEKFGNKMLESTIVVLVNSEEKRSSQPLDQVDENFRSVLDECGNRICVHKMKQDIKDTELIKQMMEFWGGMQEKQAHESSNFASGEERAHTPTPKKENPDISMMSENNNGENIQPSGGDYKITVVLLGKNSHDKCLIGNTILEKNHFQLERVTCEKVEGNVAGQMICIINTPDLSYKSNSDPEADLIEEIQPSYSGPRVFLLVLHEKKVSPEEKEMFNQLKEKFGTKMVENTIVLVNGEKKHSSMDSSKVTFNNDFYRQILDECGTRVCVVKKDMKNTELIKQLMGHMESMQKIHTFKSDQERSCENILLGENPVGLMPTQSRKVNEVHQAAAMTVRDVMTIILLGQTGSGKSATGNTILKRQPFVSYASSVPVTQVCQMEEETVCGIKIRVIDTPDFFNEDLKNQHEQIKLCKALTLTGPVVYLLVMQIGRFTDGEREVLPNLKREFGEDVTVNTVILFTGKEKLKDKTLQDYIRETDPELQELIKTCNARYHAFNNNEKSNQQVKKMMELIMEMHRERGITIRKSSHHNKINENKECRIL